MTKMISERLGPDVVEWGRHLYWLVVAPVLTSEPSLSWVFLMSTVAIALFLYVVRENHGDLVPVRGFLRFLVPREVFFHPSAVLDYKFFVVNTIAMTNLRIGSFVITAVGTLFSAEGGRAILTTLFGPATGSHDEAGPIACFAFTVCFAVANDFARFYAHYLLHRFPLLWEFHKIHHSAEVLTPITGFRSHPVEMLLDLLLRLICTTPVVAVFGYLYPTGITVWTIMNLGFVAFFYYLTNMFRHSHIALGYGPVSPWLISPVMHQVHHSAEPRHFDRNFGFIFAIWDRMFRTLYIPVRGETWRLGLPEDAGRFDSLGRLYLAPFRNVRRIVKVAGFRPSRAK